MKQKNYQKIDVYKNFQKKLMENSLKNIISKKLK